MTPSRDTEAYPQTIMDFRQSIVAELANPYLDHGERTRLIQEKAERTWDMPWSSKSTITVATIKKWLERYRRYGKEGLRPKQRSDRGNTRSITAEEFQAFVDYLTKNPRLTARSAWNTLRAQGVITTDISKSSLSRLVIARGIQRPDRIQADTKDKCLAFEFFYPLECVQSDCLHGPEIPGPQGKRIKAILIAFIDDATRRIVYADFSCSEQSLAFERGIRHILLSYGRIGRLYVDNGSTFVSLQTQRIVDTLQIHLIHSRPHKPQGRGKIERFFRTVRDQFLRPLDVATIQGFEDLNLRFHTWLEAEYHRNPHSGINGHTPLELWLERANSIRVFDHTLNLDQVFYHECHRRVGKDQTVTINGTLFEVPSILIGKKVTLRYDPHKPLVSVLASLEGKDYGQCRLLNRYANTKVRRSSKDPTTTRTEPSAIDPKHNNDLPISLVAAGLRRGIL